MNAAGDEHSHDTTQDHVQAARVRVALGVGVLASGLVIARAMWAAHHTLPSWAWFAAMGGGILLCLAPRRSPAMRRVGAALALACLSAGVFTARTLEVPRHRADRLVADSSLVTITGRVLDAPRATRAPSTVLGRYELRDPSWTFVIACRAVEGENGETPATGNVRIFLRGSAAPSVRAGDVVQATGVLSHDHSTRNPGDEDAALIRNQASRAGTLNMTDAALLTPAEAGSWDRVVSVALRARSALRTRAQDVVQRAAGDDPARRALFESLMLGRTEVGAESGEVSGTFTRLGLLHVLSISGFHLTVMAALALWLLRLTGDRGRLEPIALACIVLAYMSIVPASSPILRSGAMVLSVLAVEATGRRYDRVCVLGWIAMALLFWRPMDLWSLGFQLSLGLTALLLSAGDRFTQGLFTPVLKGLVDDATLLQRVRRGARTALAVSIMCWVVSLPAIMHASGLVSPVAVLATLVVSPIIVLMLWVGYAALLVGVFVPGASAGAAWIVDRLGSTTLSAANLLEQLPFSSLRVPIVPWWWALGATGIAVVWAHRVEWGRWKWTCVWMFVVGTLALTWTLTPLTPQGVAVRVDAFDVGDGTAMIVRSGDDAVMWDCKAARGGRGSLPAIAGAARAVGVWRVPRAVITHPDMDHFSGLPEVIEPLGIREVLVPKRFMDVADAQPASAPMALLRHLASRGVVVRVIQSGNEVAIGPAKMRFAWPDASAVGIGGDVDNEYSAVALVERAGARVLLTGDVQQRAIPALLGRIGPVDVLELPHHGAYSRPSEAWLAELTPRAVIQSTGPERAADIRWDRAKDTIPAWHTTSDRGWGAVEVLKDGSVRVRTGR